MGVSIHAIVDPTCISKAAWASLYEETLAVLREWPDPPIDAAYREVAGVEVITYGRDVVNPEGWCICGDANSRLVAESIELPRTLGVDDPRPPPSEIVLRVLADQEPPYGSEGLHWLLSNKTQGRPFHSLVLAVAMLIEHRLPHAAFVGGDFTAREARVAQSRLEPILGEVISLPICLDEKRLRARLEPHVGSDALDQTLESLRVAGVGCRGAVASAFLGLLNGSLGSRSRHDIEHAVACTDVSTLDELARESFEFLMGQAKFLFGRTEGPDERVAFPAELVEHDASELLHTVAAATKKNYLVFTEMAWDDIEQASVPELALLAMLATHVTYGLIAHQLCRAVFESDAVRRFCLEAWETTPPVDPLDFPFQARLFDKGRYAGQRSSQAAAGPESQDSER